MKSTIKLGIPNGMVTLVLISVSATVGIFAVDVDVGYVTAPMVATLFIALLFWQTLSYRRGRIPIIDIGTLTVLAIVCYTIIPILQFLLSGMNHTKFSAAPLYVLNPTPEQFGSFTWWYVVYLLSFVVGYLVTDSKSKMEHGNPVLPTQGTVKSLILLFIILSAVMFGIEKLYGINMYGVYDSEKMYDSYDVLLGMPLIFRQFYGIVGHTGVLFIVKIGFLLTIFLNWKKPGYRHIFYVLLFYTLANNILWMGARTELVLTLLASALMYHRFVKPLKLRILLSVGVILFIGFMIIGMMRGTANLSGNIDNFINILDNPELIFSINTEFQALFGGNYDLFWMRYSGYLNDVPLQFLLFDFIMIIPQQILFFEKLNVQDWVTKLSFNPGYFMFNPISQSIIGFGWIELTLRGLFLGFFFAKIRAWYVKRTVSFWATFFYFYLMIIAYYTIRGTAIYVTLTAILYRFIPVYFLVRLLSKSSKKGALTRVPDPSKTLEK